MAWDQRESQAMFDMSPTKRSREDSCHDRAVRHHRWPALRGVLRQARCQHVEREETRHSARRVLVRLRSAGPRSVVGRWQRDGKVWRSNDAAKSWSVQRTPTPANLQDIAAWDDAAWNDVFKHGQRVWVAGEFGRLAIFNTHARGEQNMTDQLFCLLQRLIDFCIDRRALVVSVMSRSGLLPRCRRECVGSSQTRSACLAVRPEPNLKG